VNKSSQGKGVIVVSDQLGDLLESVPVRKEWLVEQKFQFYRRKNEFGHVYFITNRSNDQREEGVLLSSDASAVGVFSSNDGSKRFSALGEKIKRTNSSISSASAI
jgi:hypothetical protein